MASKINESIEQMIKDNNVVTDLPLTFVDGVEKAEKEKTAMQKELEAIAKKAEVKEPKEIPNKETLKKMNLAESLFEAKDEEDLSKKAENIADELGDLLDIIGVDFDLISKDDMKVLSDAYDILMDFAQLYNHGRLVEKRESPEYSKSRVVDKDDDVVDLWTIVYNELDSVGSPKYAPMRLKVRGNKKYDAETQLFTNVNGDILVSVNDSKKLEHARNVAKEYNLETKDLSDTELIIKIPEEESFGGYVK